MTINEERIKALTQQSNAHELSPAQELFWKKIMDDLKNSTSKKILLKVEQIEVTIKKGSDRAETWNAAGKQAVKLFMSKIGWG
jgi:hypothetical protein